IFSINSSLVLRSTSVKSTGSSWLLAPTNVSISQCPKCSRDSTLSGLSSMEGPSTRRCFRDLGESFLGFRETFSSRSMFFVLMMPLSIHLYSVYEHWSIFFDYDLYSYIYYPTLSNHQH